MREVVQVLRLYSPDAKLTMDADGNIAIKRGTAANYKFTPRSLSEETAATLYGPYQPAELVIEDYRNAPGGVGPQASEWKDKPHRLVYDLCQEVNRVRMDLLVAECKIEELNAELGKGEG